MKETSIEIKVQKSNSNSEEIDYNFYFRLYRFYLNLFETEQFKIPYIRVVDGLHICDSLEIDIRVLSYTSILEELFNIESSSNFIGWQIPA